MELFHGIETIMQNHTYTIKTEDIIKKYKKKFIEMIKIKLNDGIMKDEISVTMVVKESLRYVQQDRNVFPFAIDNTTALLRSNLSSK